MFTVVTTKGACEYHRYYNYFGLLEALYRDRESPKFANDPPNVLFKDGKVVIDADFDQIILRYGEDLKNAVEFTTKTVRQAHLPEWEEYDQA